MTALHSRHCAQSQMASFIIVTPGEFCTMAKEVRQSHTRIETVPSPVAEPLTIANDKSSYCLTQPPVEKSSEIARFPQRKKRTKRKKLKDALMDPWKTR